MRHLLMTLACLPLLGACVAAPAVRQADVRLPAAFEGQTGAEAAALDLDRWWTLYGDPELERLVERALANAPDARIAAARLQEAAATRRANLLLAYPTGSLTGNATHSDSRVLAGDQLDFPGFSNSGASQSYRLNFDVSWEIDLFGRVRQGRRLIEADYAATRFNIEGTKASLAANVADTLFAVRGLALQLADAQQSERIFTDLHRVTSIRAERGLGPSSDAERAASDLAQAKAAAAQLDAEHRAARRSLLRLLGDGTDPLATLPIPPAAMAEPPPAPAAIPAELLRRRPDVREAEARLAAAASQVQLDRLELFPTFTLLPGLGLSRTDQPGFTSTTADWSVGVGLSVPVLDRPRLMALLRASGARAEQAVIGYEAAVQTAYAEADNAMIQLEADRTRIALLRSGEASARIAYEAARRRYDLGLQDLTTTLTAEQAWRSARTALISAQVQALRRSVQTFKALGGGWLPEPSALAAS